MIFKTRPLLQVLGLKFGFSICLETNRRSVTKSEFSEKENGSNVNIGSHIWYVARYKTNIG
jgi:hypothetical protein